VTGWEPGRGPPDETIGSDRLISLTRTDEGRRYFSLDGLRSVVNLTDDSGSAVASYHLDAWGNFRFPTELDSSRNRFAFTGHIWDPETGLYNAKARYFDPKLGRFLTQDSFLGTQDNPPSLHRYLYGYANPLRYVDPTGHQTVGAEYCRAYTCDDAARRHFDPLYDASVAFEEFRDSVGMGISVGAANTLLAMNSPGHMTPEAEAEYYVQPANRTEKVVSFITEVALLVGIPVAMKELAPARSEPAPTGLRVEGRGSAGPRPALEPVPTTTKPASEPIVRNQADVDAITSGDAGVPAPEQTRFGVLKDDKSVRDNPRSLAPWRSFAFQPCTCAAAPARASSSAARTFRRTPPRATGCCCA